MFKPKRITITLNSRQIGDAHIIAALETLGGESASVLKALALRGIMTDPSLAATLADGIDLMTRSRKAKGCGFKSSGTPVPAIAQPISPVVVMSPPASAPAVEPDPVTVAIQPTSIPVSTPNFPAPVPNVVIASIAAPERQIAGEINSFNDFLRMDKSR